jgi:hypothetical protein
MQYLQWPFNKETLPNTKLTDLDVCTALPDSAPLEFTAWWWQKDVGMFVSDFEFRIWRHSLPTIAAKCRLPMWWYVTTQIELFSENFTYGAKCQMLSWSYEVNIKSMTTWFGSAPDFERLYHILIHWSFSSTSMDPNNKLKNKNPVSFVKLFKRPLHDKNMTVYESSQ